MKRKKITALFLMAFLIFQMIPTVAGAEEEEKDWLDYRVSAYGELMPYQPVNNYYSQQNPPTFTWPYISWAKKYHLQIATDSEMKNLVVDDDTIMKNVHCLSAPLKADQEYFWRVRWQRVSGDGSGAIISGDWTKRRRFYVDADASEFTVPTLDSIAGSLKAHPRRAVPDAATVENLKDALKNDREFKAAYTQGLNNFQAKFLERLSQGKKGFELPSGYITATTEDELKGITVDRTDDEARVKRMHNIQQYYWWPAQYMLLLACNRFTELPSSAGTTYQGTAKKMLQEMLAKDENGYYWDPKRHFDMVDADTYETMYVFSVAFVYDWLYDELTLEERAEAVKLIGRNFERPFALFAQTDNGRNLYEYPFASTAWRMNQLTAAALMVYDETALLNDLKASSLAGKETLAAEVQQVTDLAKKIVENHFPILTAVTYPFGYQDGASNEGPYYGLSTQHLEVALTLSWLGIGDLTQKAWFQNSAKHLMYLWPSNWYNNWGDASSNYGKDTSAWKEVQLYGSGFTTDEIWKSAAKQQLINEIGTANFMTPYSPLSLFFNRNADIEAKKPTALPNGAYFPDRGWSALYSDLSDENKTGLIYKANPYGTNSHQHADNNAFTIQAYGEPLAVDSNYYDAYNSVFETKYGYKAYAHNLVTYDNAAGAQLRHDWTATANTTAFLNHSDISAVSGNAAQTFQNGGDKVNPIKKATRKILYLKPDVFLVIDDMQSADNTPHTYEFWLNALGDLKLSADTAGATITKGAAALDARVQYPAVTGHYIKGFAGPNGLDEVSPPAMAYNLPGAAQDSRVYFQTEALPQTKMVTTLSVRKSADESRTITSKNCGTYMKLTMEDGTAVYVNLTDASTVTTADNISFSGAAFVSAPDGGYLLEDGTRAVKDGTTLVEAKTAVSVSMSGDRKELAVSSLQKDAELKVFAPDTSKVSQHYDSKVRELPSGKRSSGVLWNTSGDQLNITVYPGTYSMFLNDRKAPGAQGSGTITLEIDGARQEIPFTGTYNIDGQLLYDFYPNIPRGVYELEEVRDFSLKTSEKPGTQIFFTSEEYLMTTGENPYLKIKTSYAGYHIIDSAASFEQIRENSSGKYYLAADIELPETYEPIEEFTGHLIGADETELKTIRLNIRRTGVGEKEAIGLFRKIGDGAFIKNIRLDGEVTVSGVFPFVGALAGTAQGENDVSNCVNDADVTVTTGTNGRIGGFLGSVFENNGSGKYEKLINNGTITVTGKTVGTGGIIGIGGGWGSKSPVIGCENYGRIDGGDGLAGGIIGNLYNSQNLGFEIIGCYNAGAVHSSTSGAAGIAGKVNANSTIKNSCNTGDVTSGANIYGGLIADINWNNESYYISNSYNAGRVSGKWNQNPIGYYNNGVKCTNCYYLSEASAGYLSGSTKQNLEQMKTRAAVDDTLPQSFREALNTYHTVTVSRETAYATGTVTPSGKTYAKSGEAFTVTAAPKNGYQVEKVTVNGTEIPGNTDNMYTTTIMGDTEIKVSFIKTPEAPPTITAFQNVFKLTGEDGIGSITFSKITDYGNQILDYGIVYSAANDAEAIQKGEHLSAKEKPLASGQFGVKLIFAAELDRYYTTPYLVYKNGTDRMTVYGESVEITK